MTHIDDFIDNPNTDKYASWFFMLHRLPAALKMKFRDELQACKLFCTYEGKRWRVVGASRMGDVWLTQDFEREQYTHRVDVDSCSEWSKTAGA